MILKIPGRGRDYFEQEAGAKGKKQSLLQAWSASLQKIMEPDQPIDAALYTNRDAPEISQAFLQNGNSQVDFTKIAPTIRETIIEQLGGEEQARVFFQQFRFDLNRPNLPELEDGLNQRFTMLGGTHEGWLSLKAELGKWVCYRNMPPPDGHIHLADIQRAALWHIPEGLAQNYIIPDDYVPPQNFLEDFEQKILQSHSGNIVVTGSPGIGKSTFISYLYAYFQEKDIPAVRHHYYLGSQDPAPGLRLDYLHAAQSLIHDLARDHSQALGDLRGENPRPEKLRKWLTACGEYYNKQGKTFYVLLDGLDHVWRELSTCTELTMLLNQLLPSPTGVTVICATQPVDERYLPRVFLRHTPSRDQWVQVPRLDLSAVTNWVRKHMSDFPRQEEQLRSTVFIERLATSLYKKGQGHPLHLRYTLRAIQERNLAFTEETIATLPGCPHEGIIAYYKELWHGLPEGSQAIMYLLAATQFPWARKDLIICLDPQDQQMTKIYEDLRQVEHLLVLDDLGLQPCHSSILTFVTELKEYPIYKESLLQKALSWLRQKAPDHWQWAYTWQIEDALGDDTSLYKKPTRTWVLNALAAGRPYRNILRLLLQSMECALQHEDLRRLIEVGLLYDYCYEAYQSHEDIRERLLYAQLKLVKNPHLHAWLFSNLDDLTDDALVLLAEDARTRKDEHAFNRCHRIVEMRTRYGQQHLSGGSYPSWQQHLLPQLALVAMTDAANGMDRIFTLVVRNRKRGLSREIFSFYCECLHRYRNIDHLRRLFSFPVVDEQAKQVPQQGIVMMQSEALLLRRHAVLLALEEGLEIDEVLSSGAEADPVVGLYVTLRNTQGYQPTTFHLPDHKLLKLKWHEAYERKFEMRELFYQVFFSFLANHLYSRGERNGAWLQVLRSRTWVARFLQELNACALIAASGIRASTPLTFGDFFTKLNHITPPKMNDDDRAANEYYKSACEAAINIGLDLMVFSGAIQGKSLISQVDLKQALSTEYCDQNTLLQRVAHRRRLVFEEAAIQWLMEDQKTFMRTSIIPCADRAERFACLGECAALHNKEVEAQQCISFSTEHLIAHAYHKDMLFYNVFGAIQRYMKGVPENAVQTSIKSWVTRLAPAIAAIVDYTDGDETRHFPLELADTLALIAPEKLYDYYQWQCNRGDHHQALSTLHSFLEKADLSEPVAQALALTALDQPSLHILAQRATQGDAGAQTVQMQQHAYFGNTTAASNNSGTTLPALVATTTTDFDPEQYPPDQFASYLKASSGNTPKQDIETWTNFWVTKGKKAEAYQVLADVDERGIDIGCYDQLFTLARSLYGKERAYPWLVKAHIMDHGWNWYISNQNKVEQRWQVIKDHYPDRWQEFLQDTLLQAPVWSSTSFSHYEFRRLIEYHLFMKQYEQARNLIEEMIVRSLELVSMLPFSIPEWVHAS